MEQWLPIEDFPGYLISDQGRVENSNTSRLLSIHDNGHGVLQVTLRRENKNWVRAVHRLVAEAFLDLPPDGYVPMFIDGDHTNLAASNLEWRRRWFVLKRTRQQKQTRPVDTRPILMVRTGRVYANALECARDLDALEEQILLSAQNGPSHKYKGSNFVFLPRY